MAVSFSDLEGDGYEYVNPASKHQTLSRITAKVNGLRKQTTAPLSLPKEWLGGSEEMTEALNAPVPVPTLCRLNHAQGTLERAKHGRVGAAAKCDKVAKKSSADDCDICVSPDSRFLGGMKSISMIDLTQTNGALTLPKQESPAKKYMRKSEHFSKQQSRTSRSSSEESISTKGVDKKSVESTNQSSKPFVPPKPKKGKTPVLRKQQQILMDEIKKKKDRKLSHGSLEAEMATSSNLFSKSSRVPSLRNAKSMTDLSSLTDASETVLPMHVIDFNPEGKPKGKKKSHTVTAITMGQKKKKRPLLFRLFSGFSSSTDTDKTHTPASDDGRKKTKCEAKTTSKSTLTGRKFKRYKSTSDLEIAAEVAALAESGSSEDGGSSVYADIPDGNTVDLLSDVKKAADRVKPTPGKFRTSYGNARAPALPPRNNENISKDPLCQTMSTENPYELLPDRSDSMIRHEDDKSKRDSAPPKSKSPTASESSSFVFEFDPTAATYSSNPTGHLTEFDSGGETSDESETGTSSSDLDSGKSTEASSKAAKDITLGSQSEIDKLMKVTDNSNDTRPPVPKPRPVGGVPLPSIAARIKALQKETHDAPQVNTKPAKYTNKSRASQADDFKPPVPDFPPELASVESGRDSVASSVSGVGDLTQNQLYHQESGYWSQSDNSYSDGISLAPALPPPRPVSETIASGSKYRTWSDIPSDISDLTVEDVVDSLNLLKMTRHAEALRENDVDGELLSELDEGVLQQDFGFSSFDAKKLVKFAKGWRPKLK